MLSVELSAEEKLGIIENEYNIPIDDGIREDVSVMCNLSQGILAKGEARGELIGEARGKAIGEARGKVIGEAMGEAKFIKSMHEKGYTLEQIADVAGKSIEEVKVILEKREFVLV